MTCNIDNRGRLIRLIIGLLSGAAGVWLWISFDSRFWSIGLVIIGGFAIFEAIRGWCVMRAFGFETPF